MADNTDTLRTCLYRLADLVERTRLLPLEDRARMERMIVQARQAVCEARRSEQRGRVPAIRTIVLRLLVKMTPSRAESAHQR